MARGPMAGFFFPSVDLCNLHHGSFYYSILASEPAESWKEVAVLSNSFNLFIN